MKGLPRVSFWLLAITVIGLSFANPQSRATTSANPKSKIQNPKSENWWASVQEDIRQSEYNVTWQEETYLPDGTAAYQAPNRAHNLRTYFTPEGIVVMPRTGIITNGTNEANDANFVLSWSLVGVKDAAETVVSANRLEYQRGNLTEWYVNDENGLEQGFTLERPPAANGRPLVIELALAGDVRPEVVEDGRAIEFTTPDGRQLLRYGDLTATDAAGRPLPIELTLAPTEDEGRKTNHSSRLTFHVSRFTSATYPITLHARLVALPDHLAAVQASSAIENAGGLGALPSWTAEGDQAEAYFGGSVSSAGDVNGDGYSDVVVGADFYDEGQMNEGKAFLYYGSPTGLSSVAGWTAQGDQDDASFGRSAATAGDVNGDGFSDVIVGAYNYDTGFIQAGRAFVYLGSATGLSDLPDWTADGEGDAHYFGGSVGTAGDVNGDGYDDVIVASQNYSGGQQNEGRAYVFHGASGGLSTSPNWTAESDQDGAELGSSATAGDVNGDGYSDVIIGAPYYDNDQENEGRAYVYHGSPAGLSGSPDWTAESDQTGSFYGAAVASAGDVNGDGYDDTIVGAWRYTYVNPEDGRAFIYYGSAQGLSNAANWTAEGGQYSPRFGYSVNTAGDVNGDSYSDVIIGSRFHDGGQVDEGAAFVYLGSPAGASDLPDWTAESDQAYAEFGVSVGTAGDVNGDGYDDVIVGAQLFDNDLVDEGRAYVYHGTPGGLSLFPDWSAVSDQATSEFGRSVSAAGDVNGDGYSDVVVGAPLFDNGQADEGQVFVYYGSATGPSATADWTEDSDQAGANYGYAVSAAGDVNGDGYDDLVVGAYHYTNTQLNEGRVFVYHGAAGGLPASANRTWNGGQGGALLGISVASAGDVNGDGYADVIVGESGYDNQQDEEGRARVYHGSAIGLPANPNRVLDPTDQQGAWFGYDVAAAGDVNGDGYDDVIIGAPNYDGALSDAGQVYLYLGAAGGLGNTPSWTTEGDQANLELGKAVGTAGDVDGDGYDDLIVGAPGYDNGGLDTGRASVYYGAASGPSATRVWAISSYQSGSQFAAAVGAAGDVNGDGYDDILIGAPQYDNGQVDEGQAFVYYGSPLGLLDWTVDWTAGGGQANAFFGSAVAAAGDVNGDGYSDVIVGAYGYDGDQTDEGQAYLFYGSATVARPVAVWTAEGDQDYAEFGNSVGTAGDVNGDGYADVIVAAFRYDNGQTDEGRVFVYHGSANGPGLTSDWMAEGDQAGAYFGGTVSTAGDVNGDGYADVIIGADFYDNGELDEGQAFVYFGSATGLSDVPNWTADGDQVAFGGGCTCFGGSVSTAGDVNGDGFSDIIVGAGLYDVTFTNQGRAYVYYGSPTGPGSEPNWTADGNQEGAWFGQVGTAGDVNSDGFADVIVGANGTAHAAYVFHGSAAGLSQTANWITQHPQGSAQFGAPVGTAGDVNGDGYADVFVGAVTYSHGQSEEGGAWVYHGSSSGLSTTANWSAEGEQAGAYFGHGVNTAGDVNGDGYADLIVGASHFDGGQVDEGRAILYYGSASGLRLTSTWTVESDQSGANFGTPVATAGDVNGDGYADVIIGARGYDNGQTDEGRAFLYYGAADGLSPVAGWTAEGDQDSAFFGAAVSTAGDVNGDGYADVIVGAHRYDNGQDTEGRAYVYHGSATGLNIIPNWTAEGNVDYVQFGRSVGTAGDVNGDGYDDVIVGADLYSNGQVNEGRVFVYYGGPAGLNADAGWMAESDQANASLGIAARTAGDVNGDGFADIIVGAHLYDGVQPDEGAAFVWLGSVNGINGGIPGVPTNSSWMVTSGQAYAYLGVSIGTAGDVNGDGYSDVIIGASGYDTSQGDAGKAYVYHGSASGLGSSAQWITEGDNADAEYGRSVSTAGDVNGDGYADVIVGAPFYNALPTTGGRAYVYYGTAMGLGTTAGWIAEGNQDGAEFGRSVSTSGDVNGDGYADVTIAAMVYDNGQTDEGRVFLYIGSGEGLATAPIWTAESDQGAAFFGASVDTAGDVNGDGYADVIIGAVYYDDGQVDEGRAFVYYGNEGLGLSLRPRQRRTDNSAPIAHLGASNSETAFRLALLGRAPFGRGDVRLQWEVKPLGVPFDGLGLQESIWRDSGVTGFDFNELVSNLNPGTAYHWRVCLLYDPVTTPFQQYSRWLTMPWNGWQEQDLRTRDQAISGLTASNDGPTPLGEPTTLTASITGGTNVLYEWDFGDESSHAFGQVVGHTYTAAGLYTAVVTATNPVSSDTAETIVVVEEPTSTPTNTPTPTNTYTPTPTNTPTPTATNTPTNTPSPTATFTPTPTDTPPFPSGLLFLPVTLRDFVDYFDGTTEDEPNNTYEEATGPLRSGQVYTGAPRDTNDYFKIYLLTSGRITIILTGIQPTEPLQLQLRDHSTSLIDYIAQPGPYEIDYDGPAGLYYIRIYAADPDGDELQYNLVVTYP
ncbi:MAG: FG-GAP-like repeat-containing protein [Chloroflexota bacterium]